jgi:hypothetical protein
VYGNLIAFSTDGAIHFFCADWQHLHAALDAGLPLYAALKNICAWVKDEERTRSLYRSTHEFVVVWQAGDRPHIDIIGRRRFGHNQTKAPVECEIHRGDRGGGAERKPHSPVNPVALVADVLRDCSRRGGLVLNPFVGPGTVLIAAQQTGRRAAAIELDPRSVDNAIRRWQAYTRKTAINADTGLSFAEMGRRPPDRPRGYLALTYSPSEDESNGK